MSRPTQLVSSRATAVPGHHATLRDLTQLTDRERQLTVGVLEKAVQEKPVLRNNLWKVV